MTDEYCSHAPSEARVADQRLDVRSDHWCTKRQTATGKVLWHFTMSIDGFVAGPDDEMDWMTGFSVRPGLLEEPVEQFPRTREVLDARGSDRPPYRDDTCNSHCPDDQAGPAGPPARLDRLCSAPVSLCETQQKLRHREKLLCYSYFAQAEQYKRGSQRWQEVAHRERRSIDV